MTEVRGLQAVIDVCGRLMNEVEADFVGLALQNEVGPDVSWPYATGNLNDKYKRITVRFGKGTAGRVISSGSEMEINDFPQNIVGKITDYPIFLAEKIVSSYAVPLFFNAVPKGVLLVGNREKHFFTIKERELVKDSAFLLEEILKGDKSL
jgi:nitrogen regulatory protein A